MTKSAQFTLGKLIKENHKDVRFCLISNYISKIDKILQNICVPFKFNTLPRECIYNFLVEILKHEQITKISDSILNKIITNYKSDIRSMINYLQGLSQSTDCELKIISVSEIDELLEVFINKPVDISEKKLVKMLSLFNIEKYEIVIKILNYITSHYKISNELIEFIRIVLHTKKVYTEDFNIFFISGLSSILGDNK
jgi:replication factor C subunit 3/5